MFRVRTCAAVLVAVALLAPVRGAEPAELPRRLYLGVAYGNPPEGQTGVSVQALAPTAPFATAGIQIGDVVTSVAGKPVAGPDEFSELIRSIPAGMTLPVEYRRGDEAASVNVPFNTLAMESYDGLDVEYGAVRIGDSTHRTIMLRPAGVEGPLPTLFYLQGYTCSTIDWPMSTTHPVKLFVEAMAREGFAVFRMEKSGMGDSIGVPCAQQGLVEEQAYFLEGLRYLKTLPGVDPEKVFLFGHSMGGLVAPNMAAAEPVRGMMLYGTGGHLWIEYVFTNTRRQLLLAGTPPVEVEGTLRRLAPFLTEFYVLKRDPREIIAENPDFQSPEVAAEIGLDGVMMAGRHYRFWQDVYDVSVAEALAKADTHTLAAWGGSDFVSSRVEHEWIADVANYYHPGKGRFTVVPDSDHAFLRKATEKEAFDTGFQGEFNPSIVQITAAWMREVLAEEKQPVAE